MRIIFRDIAAEKDISEYTFDRTFEEMLKSDEKFRALYYMYGVATLVENERGYRSMYRT